MHLSRYVKFYSFHNNTGRILLFSTRSLAKILVPVSLLRAIEEGTLPPREEETLARNGFLVTDPDAERRGMLSAISESEKRGRKVSLLAVMNLDCNLACRYCYEGRHRGKHYMSRETADLLVEYGEKNCLQRGKSLDVDFYGGEPLLSFDLVREIAGRLRASADNLGLDFTFSLVTNGTLLTEKSVRELACLGLKRARVTLDGPRENHDAYRPCVSGSGSFDIIIRNLRKVCDLIAVGIGGNYTRENYRDFPLLLDYLCDAGLTPDKISHVMFSPISETLGEHLMPEFSEGCSSSDEPWLIEASLFLREEIVRRGFFTPKVSPVTCMIEYRDSLVIHYDGTLYKCPAFIGCEGFDVGCLETGIRDYDDTHNLTFWKNDTCLDCAYLPLCFGGCRFLKVLRDGAVDGVECRKAYFDAALEELVLQDIRHPRKMTSSRHSLNCHRSAVPST
jgi:uncharacterized protein